MYNTDLDILNRQSEEVRIFCLVLSELLDDVETALKNSKPHLNGEKFMDNKDVCRILHLSPRTLQEYRDKGKIAFIKLEGKIIYRQSDIEKMLTNNFFPAIE